ncbi:Uncharacterized protein FKW44_011101 [Caligus rogercresseyi]|uniref:Uncharacterized protein n=1 Tax=Caligus rogercresseyi TaxID=217165 RepID=A0A7T8K8L8_CALRO|nr:Uncharacterized protein FKW44_011101 [Caligus rogercresseyi]
MSRYNNNGPPKEPEINTKDSSLDDLLDALQSYNKEGGSSPASTLKHTSSKLVVPVPAAVKTNALSNEEKSSTPNSSTPNNTVTSGTPPPPPPRTSSALKQPITRAESASGYLSSSSLKSGETSSSSESINSQEGVSNIVMLRKANSVTGPPVPLKPMDLKSLTTKSRQDALETRHQELLSRQKQLQEQYQRLQQMQENNKNKQQQQLQGKTNEVKDSGASVKETVKAFNSKAGGKGCHLLCPSKAPEKTTALSPGQAAEETEEERRGTEGEEVVKAENESKSSTKIYETDIFKLPKKTMVDLYTYCLQQWHEVSKDQVGAYNTQYRLVRKCKLK